MNRTSRKVVRRNGWDGPLPEVRIAIVGTREAKSDAYHKVKDAVDQARGNEPVTIVSGGARGYDTLAERYAAENNLPIIIFYPLWEELGKRAGYVRNIDIVKNSDAIFAWPRRGGKGTQHTINIARDLKVEVVVEEVD